MKRRKVANLMGLAVLGTVLTRPMHPYEIASVMRARGKDADLPVKWGSLYRVVQNLESHGFLQVVHSERAGGRPERTVYEITDAGRAELTDWVGELIADPAGGPSGFRAGLSLLGVLSPAEAATLLDRRVRALEAALISARAALDAAAEQVPRLFVVELEYDLAVCVTDLDWTRRLLAEITEERMSGLDQWRDFHRTGRVPADLAEAHERGTDPQ